MYKHYFQSLPTMMLFVLIQFKINFKLLDIPGSKQTQGGLKDSEGEPGKKAAGGAESGAYF